MNETNMNETNDAAMNADDMDHEAMLASMEAMLDNEDFLGDALGDAKLQPVFADLPAGRIPCYLRIAGIKNQVVPSSKDSDALMFQCAVYYQVLAVEGELGADLPGNLIVERFPIGGDVQSVGAYDGAKRLADGKSGLLRRLTDFGKPVKGDLKLPKVPAAIVAAHAAEGGTLCARVVLVTKASKDGQYVNLRDVRVVDPAVKMASMREAGLLDALELWQAEE